MPDLHEFDEIAHFYCPIRSVPADGGPIPAESWQQMAGFRWGCGSGCA
ncbi:MAG: hypothetical protein AAF787_17225 [Chloroflexota bacterium]